MAAQVHYEGLPAAGGKLAAPGFPDPGAVCGAVDEEDGRDAHERHSLARASQREAYFDPPAGGSGEGFLKALDGGRCRADRAFAYGIMVLLTWIFPLCYVAAAGARGHLDRIRIVPS